MGKKTFKVFFGSHFTLLSHSTMQVTISKLPSTCPFAPWCPQCPLVNALLFFKACSYEEHLTLNDNLAINKMTWLLSVSLRHMLAFHLIWGHTTCLNGVATVTENASDRRLEGEITTNFTPKRGNFNCRQVRFAAILCASCLCILQDKGSMHLCLFATHDLHSRYFQPLAASYYSCDYPLCIRQETYEMFSYTNIQVSLSETT